jgi:hypothetical protein
MAYGLWLVDADWLNFFWEVKAKRGLFSASSFRLSLSLPKREERVVFFAFAS